MEVERYYYAVASFMRKDDKISVTSVTCSVKGEEKDIKFYPLMNIITSRKRSSRMIWLVEQLSSRVLLRLVNKTMMLTKNASINCTR